LSSEPDPRLAPGKATNERHAPRWFRARAPLQHCNGSWPDGAAPYPRHATRGVSRLAAPATTSPARTRSRPPTAVPGSRPPLQHCNALGRTEPRRTTARHPRCVPASRPRYNGVRYGDVDERGPSGPDGRADDAVRPGGQERRGDRRLGHAPLPADVGVRHGRIVTIGRIRERAREVIDADGQVVAPGFVDGHTHMDAQVFWTRSAPAPAGTRDHGRDGQLRIHAGPLRRLRQAPRHGEPRARRGYRGRGDGCGHRLDVDHLPEFLDRVASLPKGINYACYIGHSALRTYVMGERAFEKPAGEDDLRAMERELRDAIRAGAIASRRHDRRVTRRPTGDPSQAASPPGRRCVGSAA